MYAVHEEMLPSLRREHVPVRWTGVTVRHTGYTDPALRERKLQRDCKILDAELTERPDDPFVLSLDRTAGRHSAPVCGSARKNGDDGQEGQSRNCCFLPLAARMAKLSSSSMHIQADGRFHDPTLRSRRSLATNDLNSKCGL